MCLIVWHWLPQGSAHTRQAKLVLFANRDEYFSRPAAALHWWKDSGEVVGGRDYLGGGWLLLSRRGRLAAVTNIRDAKAMYGQNATLPSRGDLCREFVQQDISAQQYAKRVAADAAMYAGFNLLLCDSQEMYFVHSHRPEPQRLSAGLYGVSNADLDTPWPKLLRAKQTLQQHLAEGAYWGQPDWLWDKTIPPGMLPDTGVGIQRERQLAPICIDMPEYGTRVSSRVVLRLDLQGQEQWQIDTWERQSMALPWQHSAVAFRP